MSSPITFRHPAIREICEVLGFKYCRSFVMSVDLDSAVTVTVERLLMDDEADAIRRVLSSHHLIADDGEVWEDEALESGDELTTVEDDNRKYKR